MNKFVRVNDNVWLNLAHIRAVYLTVSKTSGYETPYKVVFYSTDANLHNSSYAGMKTFATNKEALDFIESLNSDSGSFF